MSSQACARFAASDSSKATSEIDPEDEEDPGMEDAEEGAIMFIKSCLKLFHELFAFFFLS